MLARLVTTDNISSEVCADSAYRSQKNEKWLASKKLVSHIHRRKPAGKPMPRNISRSNAAKSSIRAHVEHVFAHQNQKKRFGLFIRTIGLARAEAKLILANIAYNFDRLIFHERAKPWAESVWRREIAPISAAATSSHAQKRHPQPTANPQSSFKSSRRLNLQGLMRIPSCENGRHAGRFFYAKSASISTSCGIADAVPFRVTVMPAVAQPKRTASTGCMPLERAAEKPPTNASPAPVVSMTAPDDWADTCTVSKGV
jgi:hypothetical protein